MIFQWIKRKQNYEIIMLLPVQIINNELLNKLSIELIITIIINEGQLKIDKITSGIR